MDSKRINLARGAYAPTTALFVATLIVCPLFISTASVFAQQLTPIADERAGQMNAEPTALTAGVRPDNGEMEEPEASAYGSGKATVDSSAVTPATETDLNATELFALGASFYSSEDWGAAIAQFQALVDQYPDDEKATSALFYLGESLIQTGHHRDAVHFFQKFVENDSDPELAVRAGFRIAECHYMSGSPEQALTSFQDFTLKHADHPLNEFALPYMAELQLDSGDAKAARTSYKAALARFPDSRLAEKCRIGLAQTLQRLGDFNEADRFYNFVAQQKQSGLQDDALLMSARMWAANGEWNICRLRLDTLEKDFPDSELNTDVQYLAAKHLMSQEKWQDAWSRLEPIIDEPWSPAQFSRIGLDATLVALRLEKFDVARSILDRVPAEETDPGLKEFGLALAIDLAAKQSKTGELESLVGQLESSFANSTYLPRSIESLARAYYVAGDYQQASARYQQLVGIAESNSDLANRPDLQANLGAWKYLRGLSLIGSGDFATATTCLESIGDFGGETSLEAAVEFALATSRFGARDFERSLPHYRKYIALLPDGPDIVRCHADLAIALVQCNRLDEAMQLIEPKLSESVIDRSLLNACESIAEAAIRTGRADVASKYFQVLTQSGLPEYASRGSNGLIWAESNEAIDWEAIDSLLSNSPTAATLEALAARAQRCQAEKNNGDAIRLFEKVIEWGGETELALDSQIRLAISLIRTGESNNLARAKGLLQTFSEIQVDHSMSDLALYELAWLHQEQNETELARASFLKIVDNHADSRYWSDALYRTATLSRQMNDSPAAVAQLTRLTESRPDESLAAFAHFTLGEIASQNGNWSEAIQHFEKVQQGVPASTLVSPSIYWMAECYYQNGQTAIAERHFQTLQGVPFTDPRTSSSVILRLAQCYGKREEWTAVRELFDETGRTNPELVTGYQFDYLRARVYMSQAKFDDARRLLTSVLNDPEAVATQTAAMSQWLIGESWFHQEEYTSAFRAYLLVDSLYNYPQWQSLALLQAAKCQARLNDHDAARKTIDRLMAAFPDSSVNIDAKQLLLQMRRDESNVKSTPATYSKPNQ